ncbi:MAG: phosphotransferase [Cyanobacteria bacterium SZAS LIN-2]|nr:phosphotransferase [Cyanobacteria bacterium SZAS LIN-2]MBS2010678.1 phosphotransferase [Cyanobacteria bacterium SZAS TMP-1]
MATPGKTNSDDASLDLMQPVPEDRLFAWLKEFYGKQVTIVKRELLRHRDLSYVERLEFQDALPQSLIYKIVLPPWDIEQDLHERILIPSISNSPQLFMAAHHGQATAMFMEDLGTNSLISSGGSAEVARQMGEEMAKMHRSYSYRTDELMQLNILRSLSPIDYESFTTEFCSKLSSWGLLDKGEGELLERLAKTLAPPLAGEPISLVHGDLYAENIIQRGNRLFIIDWSWFTNLGVPLVDLATLSLNHHKNGAFHNFCGELIESYCFESGRKEKDVLATLPFAEALSRLLFLEWLVERKARGIEGTTVGPVDGLIRSLVAELLNRLTRLTA